MPVAELLSPHFFLSQLTVCPSAAHAGVRNEPRGSQIDNLKRLAYALEVVRRQLHDVEIHVLRAFRGDLPIRDPAGAGRCVEFIAPAFGSPRAICQALLTYGFEFDRLVNAGQWVQLEIPRMGERGRRQVQTAVFEFGAPMRYLEGLV